MEKIKIASNAFVYPMPMVIVGTKTGGKINYMAVGWVTRVNFNPPMIAVALGSHAPGLVVDFPQLHLIGIGVSVFHALAAPFCGGVAVAILEPVERLTLFIQEGEEACSKPRHFRIIPEELPCLFGKSGWPGLVKKDNPHAPPCSRLPEIR